MALIKCPECGKEISDKAAACIHCGFPLSLLEKEYVSGEKKNDKEQTKNENYRYRFVINDYNDSRVKVISLLRLKFEYSVAEAKVAVENLPLEVPTNKNLDEVTKIAQELTDAEVDYDVFKGSRKLDLNVKNKSKRTVRVEMIQMEDENIYTPKCPTCKSPDIKGITMASKIGSVAVWGILSMGKVSKQWHCNKCGSEW